MFRFGIVFLIVALLAAFFGFAGVENYSFEGAKVIFGVFLIFAVAFFVGGALARRAA